MLLIGQKSPNGNLHYFFKKGEKMKGKIWVRSMFQAYNYINRVVKSIDKQVISKGVSSHFPYGYGQTLSTAELIMELIERKRHLNCVKYLVEDSLQFISPQSSKVLVLRFMDKQTDEEIAKLLNVSRRTVQRMMDKALGECYLYFIKQGYTTEVLEKYLEDETWLIDIFNHNVDKIRLKIKKADIKIPQKINSKITHAMASNLWN